MKEKVYLPGNISERVRELREERGLTRKELAQLSGEKDRQHRPLTAHAAV